MRRRADDFQIVVYILLRKAMYILQIIGGQIAGHMVKAVLCVGFFDIDLDRIVGRISECTISVPSLSVINGHIIKNPLKT